MEKVKCDHPTNEVRSTDGQTDGRMGQVSSRVATALKRSKENKQNTNLIGQQCLLLLFSGDKIINLFIIYSCINVLRRFQLPIWLCDLACKSTSPSLCPYDYESPYVLKTCWHFDFVRGQQ